jgi:uncharacterized DUF497 family protein
MDFEWDEAKNLANYAKHKVTFEFASKIFYDPLTAYRQEQDVAGEERWLAVGKVFNRHLLIIVHTYRQHNGKEYIRIISARYATPHERRLYEEG